MISREELLTFIKDNLTINDVLKQTNYTKPQIIYACKKYGLKLRSVKQKFNVDPRKVKALLDNEFTPQHIAKILNVNNRCVYNIMHRNGWTKKRQYVSNKKSKKVNSYGLKIKPQDSIEIHLKDGEIVKMELSSLLQFLYADVNYIIVREQL